MCEISHLMCVKEAVMCVKRYVMSQLSPLKMYVFVGTAPLNDGPNLTNPSKKKDNVGLTNYS